jgi:putative addiction module component (TIGR02574 family)
MVMELEALEAEIMNLPTAQRSQLLDRLITSLDDDAMVEQKWIQEAARRAEEISSGKVLPVPGEQVTQRLLKSLA